MSMRKNLSVLLASSLLLLLTSCGKDDNKKSSRMTEINPICEDISCLATVNWKIQLPGRSFPDKTRVDINGTTVLNECISKQKYVIDRHLEPQQLYLENYLVPKRGKVKMRIFDLGNCDSLTSFLDDNNVNFSFIKSGLANEIVISL